jgi:hypothetical protein
MDRFNLKKLNDGEVKEQYQERIMGHGTLLERI